MYDHLLGGTDNYPADREACADLLRIAPSTREVVRINRAFLTRAVRYLSAERGVRRFLDHGSGLPTRPNVHETAQRADPSARVLYIDRDPIVHAHGRLLLEEDLATTAVIEADIRDTEGIFGTSEIERLLEGGEPVAALFVSVLDCLPDSDDPWQLVREVARHLPAGSYLVISQLASDDPVLRERVTAFMRETVGGAWGQVRSLQEVGRFFDGFEMLRHEAPVEVSEWYPDAELSPRQSTREWIGYGGVARIP
ncbi:SAM-dependent methyltransferase [Streptomyces sp. AP-93]|nr:SAM-dependent methyltransferase [Streptomyces sp. AP-93]